MKNMFTTKILAASMMALSLGLTGCLTDSKDDEEPAPTPVAWSSDSILNVGAQGHLTLGTAIDLDARRVMTSAVVNDSSNAFANQRSIDLLFVFSGGATKLMSPVAAKAATDIPLADNYRDTVIFNTKFVNAVAAPANWTEAKTAYDAADSTVLVNSATVSAGQNYIVKTNLNDYVVITIGTIANGTANTASTALTVKVKAITAAAAN